MAASACSKLSEESKCMYHVQAVGVNLVEKRKKKGNKKGEKEKETVCLVWKPACATPTFLFCSMNEKISTRQWSILYIK